MSDFILSFDPEPPILLKFPANPPDLWPRIYFFPSDFFISFLLSFFFSAFLPKNFIAPPKTKSPPLRRNGQHRLNSGPSFTRFGLSANPAQVQSSSTKPWLSRTFCKEGCF